MTSLPLPIYESILTEALRDLAIDAGKVTAIPTVGTAALQDDTKQWATNVHARRLVKVVGGAGVGQLRTIISNTSNVLTLNQAWVVLPNQTSIYVIMSIDIAQVLRDVFGGGSDISITNPLATYDPKVGSLISYEGTATADGAADGSTIVDTGLVGEPDYDGSLVIITSGDYAGQSRYIDGTTVAGTITPDTAFDGQITEDTTFVIVGIRSFLTEIAAIEAKLDRALLTLDCWSDPQEEVSIPAVAGTLALPSVTVADLPAGAVVVKAIAMIKFRMVENTNAGANKLDGATVAATSQVIQVRDDTPGTWRDAINFADDMFGIAATTREGGDVLIGSIDIAVEVDENDTYNFQYLLAKADLASINLNDVQVGLRIWYSIST